jgi:hypothetical protein
MNWVRKSRRWLYANLILLAGFAIIGSLARPAPATPGNTALVVYCERKCDPPNYTNCYDCFAPGAPCSAPPGGVFGHCQQQPRPVGCACK